MIPRTKANLDKAVEELEDLVVSLFGIAGYTDTRADGRLR